MKEGLKSQSPEGSWSDFHRARHRNGGVLFCRMSQSPEGSWSDFHHPEYVRFYAGHVVSQSPEGSWSDFHHVRFPSGNLQSRWCRNPPKGPGPISTTGASTAGRSGPEVVAIPRRVLVRFPHRALDSTSGEWREVSQSPEGSWSDFHCSVESGVQSTVTLGSRNPPKGPGPISTRHGRHPRSVSELRVSQSPEGSWSDFHREDPSIQDLETL